MIAKKRYSGVHTALITPFKNGLIDYKALEILIADQISASIQAITLFGTTGEGPTISLLERKSILAAVRKWIPKETLLISACGTSSTQETIEQAKIGEEFGCNALQIVTPPYNRPSQEGLYRHFESLHNSISLEILLYNIPGRTGVQLEKETIQRLFDLNRIVGIKEASGNLSFLMEIVQIAREYGNKIAVLTGDDLYTLPAIQLGADGVVSVLSNLFPKKVEEFFSAALSRDENASKMHYNLKPLIECCFFESNPSPIKYMASKNSWIKNEVRLPLVPVSKETEKRIDVVLRKFI